MVLLILDIERIFGHNFSTRIKTLSYTNLVPSFGRRASLKNVAEDRKAIEIGCPVFIYIFSRRCYLLTGMNCSAVSEALALLYIFHNRSLLSL